jgi:hypothetical protein
MVGNRSQTDEQTDDETNKLSMVVSPLIAGLWTETPVPIRVCAIWSVAGYYQRSHATRSRIWQVPDASPPRGPVPQHVVDHAGAHVRPAVRRYRQIALHDSLTS